MGPCYKCSVSGFQNGADIYIRILAQEGVNLAKLDGLGQRMAKQWGNPMT